MFFLSFESLEGGLGAHALRLSLPLHLQRLDLIIAEMPFLLGFLKNGFLFGSELGE